MFWIFAAVVLTLLVLHTGFRKFALIGAGVLGAIVAISLLYGGKADKIPAWTPPAGGALPVPCTDDEAAAAVKTLSTNLACSLTSDQLANINNHIRASANCRT